MATQDEWFLKLKSWVPVWWFEQDTYNRAYVMGMAAVFAKLEVTLQEHFDETMITKANEPFLDTHGDERNVERLPSEPNSGYSLRIRNIVNNSNPVDIKKLVDALLVRGECMLIEHAETRIFCNRESFYNRQEIFSDLFYNVFSIVVTKQLHEPYSFFNRENFYNREDFVGSNESNMAIFKQIVAIVNKSKALGVLYRVVETRE